MKRILFVGEQSGGTMARPAFAYPEGAATRLAGMLGMTHGEMLECYEFVNLLSPGTWSAKIAKCAGEIIFDQCMIGLYPSVVLLGNRVIAAVIGTRLPTPQIVRLGRSDVLVFPHPSGRNRLFNDPKFKARCQRVLKKFVREDHWRSFAR